MDDRIEVVRQLFVADADSSRNPSYTLIVQLKQMLETVQRDFGERDASYTILGIEFASDGPYIWYPGNAKYVAIRLSLGSLNNTICAHYELAHECVHLLAPSGRRNANVLEEGLATHFQQRHMGEVFGMTWPSPKLSSYAEALELLERVLENGADAIKRLRKREPFITGISADLILELYPNVGEETAQRLAGPFLRGE